MGRRATSTTKGGRFMNPADQARKQQRKRELKKNKKQRHMVRQAVLKSKDPIDIIEQMEKLDQTEFEPEEGSALSDRVIQEKRQKLRETYLRVMGMYKREDEKVKFVNMKKKIQEYDVRRAELEQNFIAVKFAKESDPGEIPLPDGPLLPGAAMTPLVPGDMGQSFPSHMLLPDFNRPDQLHSILKRPAVKKRSEHPPGPPCGAAPELSDSSDEYDSEDEDRDGSRGRVRFAGVEESEKDSRTKYKKLAKRIGDRPPRDEPELDELDEEEEPPGPLPLMALRPSMPPVYSRFSRPPPPPPGLPPRPVAPAISSASRPAVGPSRPAIPPPTSAAVISAAPTVKRHSGPTIEAKPQLRNMQQEVTRFVPTTLKVHREGAVKKPPPKPTPSRPFDQSSSQLGQKSTDDAYSQFMKEMTGFL